jgi:cyclophilin family peptidyl-prolyl cis-trans isomerase
MEDVEAPAPVQATLTNTVEETTQAEPSVAAEEPQEQERNTVMILMKTSKGDIKIELDPEKAPKTVVENEASNGLKNIVGSIAMARTPDPHSASAQFFINVGDNTFLDYPGQDGWGYCVFGQVVEGMDVVDAIKAVPTGNKGPHQNVPNDPVLINEVSVIGE